MICFIALFVFAVLAIFSAKYRLLAKEAFDCVFRRISLRPCTSNLDKRLKSELTGRVLKKHKQLGRLVYRHFELLSWLLLIITILTLVFVGIGLYNYAVYGNCNGPDQTGFCIFDPLGSNQAHISTSEVCLPTDDQHTTTPLQAPNPQHISTMPQTGSTSAAVTVIEFGCYACPNTAKQAQTSKRIIEHYKTNIHYIYIDFPLPNHAFSQEASQAAYCFREQKPTTFWTYHYTIFDQQKQLSTQMLRDLAREQGANMQAYEDCIRNPETLQVINERFELGMRSGVYGTPTFFINNKAIVGVHNFKFLSAQIDTALHSSQ